MVAHVLRLRLDLLVGALRGGNGRAGRTLVELLLLAVATVAVCFAVLSLGAQSTEVAQAVAVLVGSALVLGALIAPAVVGVEDQLDPRRFAVFGLEPRPLAGALLLGAFVSVPSLALLAIACSVAVRWTERGAPAFVAWLFCLLGFVTAVIASRLSMAVSALVLHERRSREMTSLLVVAVIVIVVPVVVFFSSLEWDGVVPVQLGEAVAALTYTPLGAAWAVPGLVLGNGGATHVALSIGIAVLSLAALIFAWFALVAFISRRIERPIDAGDRGGLGWFAITPGTPGGAIAARSLVYWLRDRRYLVNIVIVPVAAVLAALPLMVAGVPGPIAALIPVPIMALLLGWMPHNDIAYDSTAIWLHIVSGVRGIADRVGRLIPIILVAIPLLAVGIAISVALHGRWAVLPAVVGVTVCLFFCGLGLSSVFSVLSPYPVTRPGDSPFQQPQRAGSGTGSQALVLLGSLLFSAPTLWWGWHAVMGETELSMTTMWVGVGTGVLILGVGLAVGAVLFDRRGSAVMEFAEAI